MANVFEPDFDSSSDREGFASERALIGKQAGAERLGATLYALPPGQAVCPYHAHLANEELVIVIAGRPSLRTPEGWRELAPGDVASFPVGAEGAHQVANFSDADARVLMVSEMVSPEIALYPDSGKIMAREQPPGRPATGFRELFREADAVDYWDGEVPPTPERD